jgi:hypothetical protein
VPVGISLIIVPHGCVARTSQLVIHSFSTALNKGMILNVFNHDFSSEGDGFECLLRI